MSRPKTEAQRERARERAREWRAANRDKHRAYCAAYAATHSEQARASKSKYKRTHPDVVNEDSRLYRQRHCDEMRARAREYQRTHLTERRVAESKRRARCNGAEGTHTADEWIAVRDYWGRCLRCGRDDVPLTEDHIIPLSRGGSNDIANIQPLCLPCNSSKGRWDHTDYRLQYWWGLV